MLILFYSSHVFYIEFFIFSYQQRSLRVPERRNIYNTLIFLNPSPFFFFFFGTSTSCYFSFPFLFHCHNSLSMSRFMIFLIFYSTLLLLRMFFSFISRWIIELFFFSPSEDNNVYFFSLSQLVFLFLLLVTLFWRCNIFRSILPTLFFFINWINSSLLLNPCNSFFLVFFSSFYIIKISSPPLGVFALFLHYSNSILP